MQPVSTVMSDPIPVGDEVTGLCQYRSRLSGADYVYAVTDAGLIHHYEFYALPTALRSGS